MPELVECPAGVGLEDHSGPVVAEAGLTGVGAEVPGGGPPARPWAALGDEHRPTATALEEPRQQMGGARGPIGPLGRPALGDDLGPAAVEVEVCDVEGQDLAGPCRCLVQHPPQRLLPQGDVTTG